MWIRKVHFELGLILETSGFCVCSGAAKELLVGGVLAFIHPDILVPTPLEAQCTYRSLRM